MRKSSWFSIVLAVLIAPLVSWGSLSTSVTYTSTDKVTLTPESNVSNSQHTNWTVSGGDSSIALVEMKTSSTVRTQKPEVYVTPKANGTATWTVKYGSSGSAWTINITVKLAGTDDPPPDDPPLDDPTPVDPPTTKRTNVFSVSPYVQHPSTNAMSIIFFTTNSCAATVKVWRQDGKGSVLEQQTACVDVSQPLGKTVVDGTDTLTYQKQYKHRVRFEDLRALTDYRYAVEPANAIAYTNVFRTLPGKDTPIRFIGYCDCETTPNGGATTWSNNGGKSNYFVGLTQGYASNLVHIVSRKPDLITISGDICAKGGFQKNWDEFWRQNAGVNAKKDGYNDVAGSIPILASMGNHDLKNRSGENLSTSTTRDDGDGGESSVEKYLTYFEYNPNGVDYTHASGLDMADTRDLSQLFHREDLGPVTLIFIDTNKGSTGKGPDSTQDYSDRPKMRSPDFHPGTLQYTWLTNNLAEAQRNSRFTFVINHHCPYSVGQHNRASKGTGYKGYYTGTGEDGESAQAVRCLTETMIKYGVDGWLCGHDEIQEHSQLAGTEILPDGTTRNHTLNVYDLGSGGDGLRGTECVNNPYEVFRAFKDSGETWQNGILVDGGCHYGFLEIDVTTNKLGKWQCSLTPRYDFIYKDASGKVSGFELRAYKDRIIIDEESNQLVYQERLKQTFPSDYVEYVRPPQAPDAGPVDPLSVTPQVQEPTSGGTGVSVTGTVPEGFTGAMYTLLKQNAAGTFEGVDGAQAQTSSDFTITETGLYKIQVTANGTTANSSETIGVLKYDAPQQAADQVEQTTIVAVPWAVTLDALLRKRDFTSATGNDWQAAIKAYNAATRTYEMWTLTEGAWAPCSVVSATEAGKSVVSTSAPASTRELARGGAVWVTRKNATKPFFLGGIYPDAAPAQTVLTAGWNLVANPLLTPLDLNKAVPGSDGDQIIVPSATGIGQTNYTYKDGSWGYMKTETVTYTIGGKSVSGVKNTWTPSAVIAPGQGFWFVSGRGNKTIDWAVGK